MGTKQRTPRGTRRREAAFERRATQHHDFIGEAEPERAEAEFHKHERLEEDAVKEMAREFEKLASEPERPFVDQLRAKAEERLEQMPEPVRRAVGFAEGAFALAMVPVRLGLRLVRDVLNVPAAMLRGLARQEA